MLFLVRKLIVEIMTNEASTQVKTNTQANKLWLESTTNPVPVLRIARYLGIGQKCNQVVPWSLHTFPENFMQIGPAVFS